MYGLHRRNRDPRRPPSRDGAAGFEDARHHSRVDLRDIAFEQRRAVHHGNAGDADVVLDRNFLAAQQSIRATMDIRLPVPGAVRVFRRRRPVSRRPRRHRRQCGRDQLVKPAIRSQRSLESLLKGCNFVSVENEAEIGSKVFDLLQCRKPNRHASPSCRRLEAKRKKPSVTRTGLEWHQRRCYQWSRRITLQNETLEVATQTSSAARELFRNARIYVPFDCVLASPVLSMRCRHLF